MPSAAGEAEQVLRRILDQIGWGFQAVQSGDRTPPPHPATLRKWRWQMARQILALRGFTPAMVTGSGHRVFAPAYGVRELAPALDTTQATEQRRQAGALQMPARGSGGTRPGPLDWPWRETPQESVPFGPDMLLPSDFESGLKPWRVEAWNGQGQGQLVRDEKHRGQQSVRIVVPATSGNRAVTVLVWPQYGDGKLNLTLAGERTYEFAAWVKLKDRGVPPELRVNVSPSAIASNRTGRDQPAPDGWQRLWTRVELKSSAPPTYLAVWVQGPGTVWVDDLSLREVIPPPLALSLDQGEYDALDTTATGVFTVDHRLQPAQVRVSLASPSRGVLDEVTIPSAPQRAKKSDLGLLMLDIPADLRRGRFAFNPSALVPDSYECRVTLLDATQREIVQRSGVFARIPDAR